MRKNHIVNKIKPQNAGIENNAISKMANSPTDWTFEHLLSTVLNGQTVVCDSFKGMRKQANFIESDLLCLDFDEDPNIEAIISDLRAIKFEPYLVHETFSSTPEKLKYHVFIRFDTYIVDVDFLVKIYKYLEHNISAVVDKSTTNNVCRLVYSTNKDIPEYFRFNKLTKIDSIDLEAIKAIEVASKKTPRAKADKIWGELEPQATIRSINKKEADKIIAEFEKEVTIDDNYDRVVGYVYAFNKIHSMGNSTLLTKAYEISTKYNRQGIPTLINRYLNTSSTIYMSAKSWEIYNKIVVEDVPITEVYDILKNCDNRHLNDDEYITPEVIEECLLGNNLLVAPPGSGKTTAIIKYALEKADRRTILCVPTITIAEQLHAKYGDNEDMAFVYSKKKKDNNYYEGKENARLIVTTYLGFSQMAYLFQGNFIKTPNVIIDEAHEFISFSSMEKQRSAIRDMFTLFEGSMVDNDRAFKLPAPKSVLWVTATPFNLADVFDKKVLYKKQANKEILFHETKNIPKFMINTITEELYLNPNIRILIYVNSDKKGANLAEKLNDKGISAAFINSAKKKKGSDEWDAIIKQERIEASVLISTKILNIGVDCQGLFDLLIYANANLDANSALQFSNRDRQASKFIMLYSPDDINTTLTKSINTYYTIHEELFFNENISLDEQEKLDRCKANGRLNEHFITEYFPYQKHVNISVIVDIFKYMFEDLTYKISGDDEDKAKPLPKSKVMDELKKLIDEHTLEQLYILFMDNKLGEILVDVNKGVRRELIALLRSLEHHGVTVINCDDKMMLVGDIGDGVNVGDIPIYDLIYYRDVDVWLQRYEDEGFKDIVRAISICDVITKEEREDYVNTLNDYKCPINQVAWNDKNIFNRLSCFGISFSVKKIRVGEREDNEFDRIYINDNILFGS